jgi:hypothetical protein
LRGGQTLRDATHVENAAEAVEPAAAWSVMNIVDAARAWQLLGYDPRCGFGVGPPVDDRRDRRAEGGL